MWNVSRVYTLRYKTLVMFCCLYYTPLRLRTLWNVSRVYTLRYKTLVMFCCLYYTPLRLCTLWNVSRVYTLRYKTLVMFCYLYYTPLRLCTLPAHHCRHLNRFWYLPVYHLLTYLLAYHIRHSNCFWYLLTYLLLILSNWDSDKPTLVSSVKERSALGSILIFGNNP